MSDPTTQLVLLLHAGATLAMFGLIWFVQIVHYPLMARVGGEGYTLYQHTHMSRTTWVVAPLMLVELASAVLLIPMLGSDFYPLTSTGLLLVVLIWGSTAALQVPSHKALTAGFEQRAHRRLVATNWVRTVLWSARSVLACVLIATT
jgi:hypothetical protein